MSEWKAVPVSHIETLVNHTRDCVVACNGLKCREPNCESCCGEEAHVYIQKCWDEVGAIVRDAAPDTHVAVERATVKKAREAFEASGLMKPHCYRRHPEGDYRELATQFHWRAWLAAYKSLGVIKEGEE